MNYDAKIPAGPLEDKWRLYKDHVKLVSLVYPQPGIVMPQHQTVITAECGLSVLQKRSNFKLIGEGIVDIVPVQKGKVQNPERHYVLLQGLAVKIRIPSNERLE